MGSGKAAVGERTHEQLHSEMRESYDDAAAVSPATVNSPLPEPKIGIVMGWPSPTLPKVSASAMEPILSTSPNVLLSVFARLRPFSIRPALLPLRPAALGLNSSAFLGGGRSNTGSCSSKRPIAAGGGAEGTCGLVC